MALTLTKSNGSNSNNLLKGRIPTKNYINLAKADEKKINLKIAIPVIILIIVAAALFSKFLVFDRFEKVARAEAEVASLQRQVDDMYAEIAGYGELAELYAHYTYANMTEEELNRVDRILVIDMLRKKVMDKLSVSAWRVEKDQLNVTVTGESLEKIDLVFRSLLEDEPIVEYYMVNSASTETTVREDNGYVTAIVTITIVKPQE